MTKKDKQKLIKAFNVIAGIVYGCECNNLHHKKANQHKIGEECKAQLEATSALLALHKFMQDSGI